MRVKQIMTQNPACCTRTDTAQKAATLMRDHDCGAIPVVQDLGGKHLIGIVTDRDLAIRALAQGQGPEAVVGDLMTDDPVTCVGEDSVEDLRQVMVEQLVRRVPVVDEDGVLVGIVAQADLARVEGAASDREVGRVVEAISEPRSNLGLTR